MTATRRHNLLVPGWIMTFGLVAVSVPPPGALESLYLFAVGIFVIPALIIFPLRSARKRAPLTANQE